MATVDIIIRMIDQTGGASNKTVANLKEMSAKILSVGAAAGAVALGLKKFYDVAKQGSELQLTTDRFDKLSKSIGTTSDALLGDLRTATRGLYSDMELMASATDFMSLGLAKTKDEAVRLAAVSSGLNMNMNQLVLTLTNMTTMRFDALGVSVDGFKDKVKELEKSGMDANAAFKEAFLQQAEAQLERVGHAADSTAGKFMQLEAAVANWGDTLKKNISNDTVEFLDDVSFVVDRLSGTNEGFDGLATKGEKAIRILKGFTSLGLSELFGYLARDQKATIDGMQELEAAGYDVAHMMEIYNGNLEQAVADTRTFAAMSDWSMGEKFVEVADAAGEIADATAEAAAAQKKYNEEMDYLAEIMSSDLSDAQEEYTAKIADLNKELAKAPESEKSGLIDQIKAETDAYNERATAIMFNIQQQAIMAAAESGQIDYSQASAAISTLAQDYGLIDEKQKAVMDGTQMLIDQFADTGNMDNFTAGLELLRDTTQALPEPINNSAASAQDFNKQLKDAITLLGKLPPSGTTWDYTFNLDGGVIATDSATGQTVASSSTSSSATATKTEWKATGGKLDGSSVTFVGDGPGGTMTPYTEAIVNGYVLDAKTTKEMAKAGLFGSGARFMRVGGSLDDPSSDPSDSLVFGPTGSGNALNSPLYTSTKSSKGGGGDSFSSADIASAVVVPVVQGVVQDITAQTQATITAMQKVEAGTRESVEVLKIIASKIATAPDIGMAVNADRSKFS